MINSILSIPGNTVCIVEVLVMNKYKPVTKESTTPSNTIAITLQVKCILNFPLKTKCAYIKQAAIEKYGRNPKLTI